ncbi:protein kinase domain-containing protein [Sorangium sp. So ce1000]|uniref:protein kinase domain-containing protein n=1 Tax=Sorangium sp. So ce1000 TaxID=3133325 RepID=UPI003F6139E7
MSRLPEPPPAALSLQFLAEIASGATTRVDLCRSAGPHRPGELLAVKRLHPHFAEDQNVATRFLDEVRTTAALKHPNVVEVAGWGTDEQGWYFAVELVQGVSLARLMKTVFDTGEMFSERLVVHIGATLCRGLAAAHELRSPSGALLNLVHRDLTPGNVLVGFQGEVKIADFGLAKSSLRVATTAVGARRRVTTYMPPEQARGGSADRRSDLFSLGVVLFELFTGKHPWPSTSDYELLRSMSTQPAADLRELRPKIDKELVSIVMRCLERDPPSRFQSADEILARLEGWLHSHGYLEGNEEALGRFVRRNAMRQMRWFERAVTGGFAGVAKAPRPSLSTAEAIPRRPSTDPRGRGASAPERLRGNGAARAQDDDVTGIEARRGTLSPSPTSFTPREADAADEDLDRRGPMSSETADEATVVVGSNGRGRADPASSSSGGGRRRSSLPSYGSITAQDSEPLPMSGNEPPLIPAAAALYAEHDTGSATPVQGVPGGVRPLHVEVDRLATEALRLREEARFAVAHAERKLALAKVAAHLSEMAAEALRLSASAAPERASHRLDEALALERAMHKVMSTPLTLAPEATALPAPWGNDQRAFLAQLGLEHLASPAASRPSDVGAPPHRLTPAPGDASAFPHRLTPAPGDASAAPSITAAHPARGDATGAPSAALAVRGDASGGAPISPPSSADADAFHASLRPMLLGVPRTLALTVAAAAFMAFVLLAWFYS